MKPDKEQWLAAYLADPDSSEFSRHFKAEKMTEATTTSGGLQAHREQKLLDQLLGDLPAEQDIDVDKLLHLLDRNKVPLLAIRPDQGKLQETLCAHPAFREAQAKERACHDRLRQEYLTAQALWREAGIEDVLIKSTGTYPSFPYKTSNLDTLMRPAHSDQARRILRDNGYVELRNVEENHKFLFRKFHEGQEISALHVHEHVGWYASFLDEESLWNRCRPAPDDTAMTIPSPEDIFLITVAHSFYEDKDIKLADLAKVHHCLRLNAFDWEYVHQVSRQRSWADGLQVALLLYAHVGRKWCGKTPIPEEVLTEAARSLPSWMNKALDRHLSRAPLTMPFRIPFILSKYHFYGRLWRDRDKRLLSRLSDLAIHTLQGIKLRLHLHSQPSMLICFSGIDGSGKTAHALALQKAFEGCHIRARYVWSRGGSSPLTDLAIKIAKGMWRAASSVGPTSANEAGKIERRKAMLKSPLIRGGWSWLTALDLAGQYLWHVRLPLFFGQVVICDRYVYDAWVEWAAYFGAGEHIREAQAARFLRWIAPRPRLTYLLDLPACAAQSRATTSSSFDFMAEQAELYRKLAKTFGAAIQEAARPFAELSDEIVHQVLTTYFDHYWTLLNALCFRNPQPMPASYNDGFSQGVKG